jgi:hypothetical protein
VPVQHLSCAGQFANIVLNHLCLDPGRQMNLAKEPSAP